MNICFSRRLCKAIGMSKPIANTADNTVRVSETDF